jgi:hypothetical protein
MSSLGIATTSRCIRKLSLDRDKVIKRDYLWTIFIGKLYSAVVSKDASNSDNNKLLPYLPWLLGCCNNIKEYQNAFLEID